MNTQNIRDFVIVPQTPEEAQKVADRLVEMGERVFEPDEFAECFNRFGLVGFDGYDWVQCNEQPDNGPDKPRISAADFLAGDKKMSEVEYWKTRAKLLEKAVYLIAVDNKPDEFDATYSEYNKFIETNPEP
jgi:hypothetical protein